MKTITFKIDGMMCGMCEAHVNDTVRKTYNVKKVKSNHRKGTCVIKCDDDAPVEKIAEAISNDGYRVLETKVEAA